MVFAEIAHPKPYPDQKRGRRRGSGLTRLDLLALLGGLAVLAMMGLPGLAGAKANTQQAQCFANLRLIGRGVAMWGFDHGNRVPCRTPQSEGGTMLGVRPGNAWVEWQVMSNELGSPKVLVCPGDTETKKIARSFTTSPDGGFLNANYRGNALSYFIGLDVYPERPSDVLAGDRNFQVDLTITSCSSGINSAQCVFSDGNSSSRWTNGIHWPSGNVLLFDGQVRSLESRGFIQTVGATDDNGSVHLLMPRY